MADDPRRSIPGVDRLLESEWCGPLIEEHGQLWVTRQIQGLLEELRGGSRALPASEVGYEDAVRRRLETVRAPSLAPVINGTGVILHTNLGRAPLARAACDAMVAAAGYGNLEYDLATGERGSRYAHCVGLLRELTGAEDALVVNNCAAAVALALAAYAGGRGVVVSHGELIEIGGGFRIPEVVESAGARLVAVGTTNRTRSSDYENALASGAIGAILKVHRSNFELSGFTEEADLASLVALGREHGAGVIYDLGSGLLLDPELVGLPPEPTPAASVAAGVDLVAFSGDKLLGGPQAGILVGSSNAVARARQHPLCRAVRTDKVTLAGLEATLALYRNPPRALRDIPVLRMLTVAVDDLENRARALAGQFPGAMTSGLHGVAVAGDHSLVGGGTFPGLHLDTWVLKWTPLASVDSVLAKLRNGSPPVVARAHEGQVVVDLRTVAPEEESDLFRALTRVL